MHFLLWDPGRPLATRWGWFLLVAALSGCGGKDVQVYQVAKEQPQPQQQMQAAGMPPGHPDVSGAQPGGGTMASPVVPSLGWKLPAGWEEATPGEMRVASFRVPGKDGKVADVSVIPLPGLAGGDLGNVNRWRAQVGQPPVSQAELEKLAQPVDIAGQSAQLYDQAGQNPGSGEKTRILAAIQRREGMAWFFKMTGDDDLVAQQKPAFVQFLKSVTFAAPSEQAQLPPSHPPIEGGLLSAQGASAADSSQAKPTWQVPAGWQETPGGQFLVAKFILSGTDNAQAAVNVSMSSGEGGGLAANVNRWRRQIGLGELPEADISKLATTAEVAGGKAMFVDMSGTDARSGQRTRLVGAMVPRHGQTWFYKLMGSDTVVEREKEAFNKFVETAKYP